MKIAPTAAVSTTAIHPRERWSPPAESTNTQRAEGGDHHPRRERHRVDLYFAAHALASAARCGAVSTCNGPGP